MNSGNIDGFIPGELCNILGTEYIEMGTVSVLYTSTTNYSGLSQTTKKKDDNKKISFTSASSSSADNFKTQVEMKIYSDQGQNIICQ